jgi:type II secretory pathway pseudopilin PulG
MNLVKDKPLQVFMSCEERSSVGALSKGVGAFTLVELVFVVFLVAVISGFAYTHLDSAIDEARYIECEGQLESIRRAKSLFVVDHLGQAIDVSTNAVDLGVFESYFVHPPPFPPHCPRLSDTNPLGVYQNSYNLYQVAVCPYCATNIPTGVRPYTGQP